MNKLFDLYVLTDNARLVFRDKDKQEMDVVLKYHLLKKSILHKKVYGYNIYSKFHIQNYLEESFITKYEGSFYVGYDTYNINKLCKNTLSIKYEYDDYLYRPAEKYAEKWIRKHTKFLSNIYNYISNLNDLILAPDF